MALVRGVEPPPPGTIFQASRSLDRGSSYCFQTINVLERELVSGLEWILAIVKVFILPWAACSVAVWGYFKVKQGRNIELMAALIAGFILMLGLLVIFTLLIEGNDNSPYYR